MAKRRKTTKTTRVHLYAASEYLNSKVEKELGLQIPFDVYLQDPLVGEEDPKFGFDEDFHVRWEPGIARHSACRRRRTRSWWWFLRRRVRYPLPTGGSSTGG